MKRTKLPTMLLLCFYLAIITAVTSIACYFAYRRQFAQLVSEADLTLLRLSSSYEAATGEFWDVFMPIYQSQEGLSQMYDYFSATDELTPFDQIALQDLMADMALRSDRIRWLALINQDRAANYYYQVSTGRLHVLPKDFPYWELLKTKTNTMAVFGEQSGEWMQNPEPAFAIAGGAPTGDPRHAIMVGYDIFYLQKICESMRVSSLQYNIFYGETRLFGSQEDSVLLGGEMEPGQSGFLRRGGERWYFGVSEDAPHHVRIYYAMRGRELFLRSHRYTPMLLLVVLLVGVASWLMYLVYARSMQRQLDVLLRGLARIGENHLDYRFEENFRDSDFQTIAQNINAMAQNLQESVERAYYFELRQREAEMQELQAKFNPHFLYNSLDMLRSRCYQYGDSETADLIAQTASIFRGFIDARKFISMQDELAFSRRYLTLFRAKYGDSVEIRYDIDTEVLQYGIIRNVFQPLIENYFVHGIDSSRDDNYISLRGTVKDASSILLTVEDNGLGIDAQRLEELRASLAEPIRTERESYGLKNLSQRIRLFYGEGYGLALRISGEGHLIQEMTIARWTVEDVERRSKYTAGGEIASAK